MKFVYNAPAIFHKGALIIGDTHFGIEERLGERGIFASDISMQLVERIRGLIRKTRAKRLIIVGDVKDRIGMCDEITKHAFEELKKLRIEIIVVRGNHDGGIEELGITIIGSEGFVYKGIALAHGHAWPSEECMNAGYLVTAHQHPLIEQTDRSGRMHSEPAWVISTVNKNNTKTIYKRFNPKIKLILMPAFNSLVGSGLNLKSRQKHGADEHLGPLPRNKLFKYNDALAYNIKGICLGPVIK